MLRDFAAYQLAKDVYQQLKRLRVPLFLQEQLYRASASVLLNLAEGSGKQTAADQRRFYGIALGSLRECEAILEMEEIPLNEDLKEKIRRLGAMLFRLSRIDKSKPQTPNDKP